MVSLTTFIGNSDFVRMLIDAKVEFLVIGGLAVAFHKCRNPLKVDDLDLLLEPSVKNIKRFIKMLSSMKGIDPLPTVEQLGRPDLRISFKVEPIFYLDVLTPGRRVTGDDVNFDDLLSRNESGLLRGRQGDISVPIISLSDLVKLKRRAVDEVSSQEKKKHEDDLRCLENRLRLQCK
jgi:glutaredoxin-related protein